MRIGFSTTAVLLAGTIVLAAACSSKPPAGTATTDRPAAKTPAPNAPPAPTGGGLLNSGSGQIGSKTVKFASDTWIPVGLTSEGIEVKEIRFAVEGGVHWNPLRAGIGPQAFVSLQNHEAHETRSAVAVALFDGVGSLLGATEAGAGNLGPNESKEMKLTFREVKRRFFDAKTAQIALETYK